MNTSDLVVEVRDADLERVAQLTEDDLSGLIIASRHNDVGSWQLTLPDTVLDEKTGDMVEHAAAQHLRKEGAGIIVTAPGADIPAVPPTYGPGDVVARNEILNPAPYASTSAPANWALNRPANGAMTVPAPGEVLYKATVASGLTEGIVPTGPTMAAGRLYGARVQVKAEGSLIGRITYAILHNGTAVANSGNFVLTGDWQTIDVPATAAVATGAQGRLYIYIPNQQLTDSLRVRQPQIEQVTAIGQIPDAPFFTGSTPTDPPSASGYSYTWEGTPNATASVKRAYALTTPGIPAVPTFETLISGPMTSATYVADENDLTGKWSFTGVSDAVVLSDAIAFPDPQSSADPALQTRANDTRTGTAEDLIRQYVAYNITPASAPAGRIVGLRSHLRLRGTSQARGIRLTKSPRFQNLLELCQEIGFAGGVNFDVVQVGTALELVVTTPADRTRTIRMDMANQLLKSVTYGYGAPTTTLALVAGQGVGTERQLISRTSADATSAEQRWGRRVERFIDQRQTDDEAELIQKGDEEVLAGAASAKGLQAAPTDSDAMLYLRDWRTGDLISVVVEGQEVSAQVTEAAISVDGSAVVFVATLGNPGAFDVDAASQRRAQSTSSRVSAIERTLEVPASLSFGEITGTLPLSRTTGSLDVTTRTTGNLDLSTRTSGDLPLSRTTGSLDLTARTTGTLAANRVAGYVATAVPRGTTAERDAFYGNPSTDPARVALANVSPVWFNTELGWEESYYATTGLPGLTARGLISGVASGWYPVGPGPRGRLQAAGAQAHGNGSYFTNWLDFGVQGTGGSSWRNSALIDRPGPSDLAAIRTKLPGRYNLATDMWFPNGSGTGVWEFGMLGGIGTTASQLQNPVTLMANYGLHYIMELRDVPLGVDGRCYVKTIAASWNLGGWASWMQLEYVGPALVSV